jgi:hypothetical protein
MPKACEASNKMMEGKLTEAVFDRLSKRKEKATVLTPAEVSIEQDPIVQMHRQCPISDALYDLHKMKLK